MEVFLMVRRKNSTIFLDVLESTTVNDVKLMIEGITKRKPEEQMLIRNNTVLEDGKKMADYNLTTFTTSPQSPATLGLCFMENGNFETLEITPLSVPPELPDELKPTDAQGIEASN